MTARDEQHCPVASERPELYFCSDLEGYGWIFRKGSFLNVGFGRRDARSFPARAHAFWSFLRASGRVPAAFAPPWSGHAYRLYEGEAPQLVDDGVLLVGDAAGLAYSGSGEGIAPAIESGRLAAAAVAAASGRLTREAARVLRDSTRLPLRPAGFGGRGRARSARAPRAARGPRARDPVPEPPHGARPHVPAPAAAAAHGPRSLFRRTRARPRLSPGAAQGVALSTNCSGLWRRQMPPAAFFEAHRARRAVALMLLFRGRGGREWTCRWIEAETPKGTPAPRAMD